MTKRLNHWQRRIIIRFVLMNQVLVFLYRRPVAHAAAWISSPSPSLTRRIHHQRRPFHLNAPQICHRNMNRWRRPQSSSLPYRNFGRSTTIRFLETTTTTTTPQQQQPQDNAIYQELKSVAETLMYHDSLYYTPGVQPEITDEEYDALVQREIELCTQYPESLAQWKLESKLGHQATRFSGRVGKIILKQPQEENQKNFPTERLKRQHLSPMLSLDNITTKEQFLQWLHRLRKYILPSTADGGPFTTTPIATLDLTTEPKLDGLSLSLRYTPQQQKKKKNTGGDGMVYYKLEWASTRGDGRQGQDVTHAIANDMNHTIPPTFQISYNATTEIPPPVLEIRGEVVVPCTVFETELKSQHQFSNARNAASGILLRIPHHQNKDKNDKDENPTENEEEDLQENNNEASTPTNNRTLKTATTTTTKQLRSYLQFYAYDVVLEEKEEKETRPFANTNHMETRFMLQQIGFHVPEPLICTTVPLFNEKDASSKTKDDHDDDDDDNDDSSSNTDSKEDDWDTTLAIEPLLDYYTALMNYRLSKDISSSSSTGTFSSSFQWGDYDMDGAVHKVSDHTLRHMIGSHTRSPRWAVAHKFPPTTAVTQLQAIEIQVGRTGALTPVALLKAVDIDGVTIQRATLHNFKHAQQILGLSSPSSSITEDDEDDYSSNSSFTQIPQNCSVIVRRAGDVIPQVVRRVLVNQEQEDNHDLETRGATTFDHDESSNQESSSWISLEAPSTCPECGSDTILEKTNSSSAGQVVRCGGPPLLCPPRAVAALRHAYSRDAMDITGLSEARIEQLREAKILHAPSDLFRLISSLDDTSGDTDNSNNNTTMQEQIMDLPGWGSKSVQNLVHQATRVASDGISLQRYIYSLGIRHVGRNTSRLLASVYGTVDNFLKAMDDCSKLQQQEQQQQQQELASLESKQGEETTSDNDDDDNNDTVKIIYFPELTGTEDTEGVKDIGPVTISSLVSFSQEEELVRSAKALASAILIHDDEDAFSTRSKTDDVTNNLPLPLEGLTIVFTGSFPNMKRKEAQELAKRMGAKSTPGSISKSTNILVAGDKVGPKKLEKATTLGIRIVDPAEFLDMVKES